MKPRPKTDSIVLHNSRSPWGNAHVIRKWHTDTPPDGNGWDDIGYHFIINNAYTTYVAHRDNKPDLTADGYVSPGRALGMTGAHCHGLNWRSVGICMVGNPETFTRRQWYKAALIMWFLENTISKIPEHPYKTPMKIVGHRETRDGRAKGKTCPDIDMDAFREHYDGLLIGAVFPNLYQKALWRVQQNTVDWASLQEGIIREVNHG